MSSLKKFLTVSIICFFPILAFAQNNLQENTNTPRIPEGMESIQIGGSAQIIVPKGAKTRKVGAQIIVEGTKEYMSRRFIEMEARFAAIEKSQAEMKQAIEDLSKVLKELNKAQASTESQSVIIKKEFEPPPIIQKKE